MPRRLCLLVALIAAGCGPAYRTADVDGVVLLDGRPAGNVFVRFLPDPEQGTSGPASEATTDAAGRFTLTCRDPKSGTPLGGAVVGRHRALASDLDQKAAPQGQPPRPTRFPAKYGRATETPLRFSVEAGPQTLTIELASK